MWPVIGLAIKRLSKQWPTMTEKDKALIEKAKRSYWAEIEPDEADTEEAREILHRIAVRGYHNEEYQAGLL